jgi:hypothetical protein
MAKLKIEKTSQASGISVDQYVSPTLISSGGYNNKHIGGVGGAYTDPLRQIKAHAKVDSYPVGPAEIIRQKGAHKFLVAALGTTIQDENIVLGNEYRISFLGTTNWQALGAGPGATVGDVFTAIKSGAGLTTTGQVNPVATCTLVNTGSPSHNEMYIGVNTSSGYFYASRITNKWVYDFTTPIAKKYRYWLNGATTDNDYATDAAAGVVGFVSVDGQ